MAFTRNPRSLFIMELDKIPTGIKVKQHMIGDRLVSVSIPRLGSWQASSSDKKVVLKRVVRSGKSIDSLEDRLTNMGFEYELR